jgi:sirohydrochlorin cobaltochelatase
MTADADPLRDGLHDGLLLFAHGARDPRWAEPFEAVAAAVRARHPARPVRLAFLEFMSPALPQACAELAAAGCRRVAVLPLFLGAGGHVRRDLPALLAQADADHAGRCRFVLQPAVGEQPALIEAMAALAAAQLEPAR